MTIQIYKKVEEANNTSSPHNEKHIRYSKLPIKSVRQDILYEQGDRRYTHQCSNLASSTLALQTSVHSRSPIRLSPHLNPEIDYLPQLQIKISRLIHSHFISLALFYNSERRGYRPLVDQTCLQIGEGLGEEREGLHSNLLPGLNIEWVSRKDYTRAMQYDYIAYLNFHLSKYKALCEKYADKKHVPTKNSIVQDLDYLNMDPFRKQIRSIGIELKKIKPEKFHESCYRHEIEAFEALTSLRKSLKTLKTLLENNLQLYPQLTLRKLRSQCVRLIPLLNTLYNSSHYLKPSIRCSSLKTGLENSDYYLENNRVDDMPKFLNQWDGDFLESRFRPFAKQQLTFAAEGRTSPGELAEDFVAELREFLDQTKENMRLDIKRYQDGAKKFEEVKELEERLLHFFRTIDLADKHEEGFKILNTFFEVFITFDEHIQALKRSKITPARQIVKELMKTYGDHKRNLLQLYRQLFELRNTPTVSEVKRLINSCSQFDPSLWVESANKIKHGQKAPWSDLITNIQRSIRSAHLKPLEILQFTERVLQGDEYPGNSYRLPEALSHLEPANVIPYETRSQLQEIVWGLLLDHVKTLVETPKEDLSFGEQVFLELLNISHLDLNLKEVILLEGPYLLTEVELTNIGLCNQTLQNCIQSIEQENLTDIMAKDGIIDSLATLIEKFPHFPESEYKTELNIFQTLKNRLEVSTDAEFAEACNATLETLKSFMEIRNNEAFKTAANMLNRLNITLPTTPFEIEKEKSPYRIHACTKAQPKIDLLKKFILSYRKNTEALKKDVENGEFFFIAASIERQYPGSVHPIRSRKNISTLSAAKLGPAFGIRIKQLYKEKNLEELEEVFNIHHLDEHEFVRWFKECENSPEELETLVVEYNQASAPLEWNEVLQNEFIAQFQERINANDLQALETWTQTLCQYYRIHNSPEAEENYQILHTRFQLARRLIHVFSALIHNPKFSDSEISFFLSMVMNNNVQSIVNGYFFKKALTFFTSRIQLTKDDQKYPQTHEGILSLWDNLCLFLQVGAENKARLHINHSIDKSRKSRPLIADKLSDKVDKEECLVSNPFEEFKLAVRDFGDITHHVIPCYEESLSELDEENNYDSLMKELVINELDLQDFVTDEGGNTKKAKKILNELPLNILASMLTPTILKRLHQYKVVQVDRNGKLFQTLFANPSTFECIQGRVCDLIKEKQLCEMEFLREMDPGDQITVLNFKPLKNREN